MEILKEFDLGNGVYAAWITIAGTKFRGALHFGPIPTFDETKKSLEVFFWESETMNCPMRIFPLFSGNKRKVRDVIKFPSVMLLPTIGKRRCRSAKSSYGITPFITFGYFAASTHQWADFIGGIDCGGVGRTAPTKKNKRDYQCNGATENPPDIGISGHWLSDGCFCNRRNRGFRCRLRCIGNYCYHGGVPMTAPFWMMPVPRFLVLS